jgi:O-antigen/teichoic acid export membrane protein
MRHFLRNSSITLGGQILRLAFGLVTSVIIARILGPEGRGIYALCILLPFIIVTFANLGIVPATAYLLASRRFPPRQVLGGNILLSAALSMIGMAAGYFVVFRFGSQLFPSVSTGFLFFSLLLIPAHIFFRHIQSVSLGLQNFRYFNLAAVVSSILFLVMTVTALIFLRMNIWGALMANMLAWLISSILIYRWSGRLTGGVLFRNNGSYIWAALKYGIQAHLGNLFCFLSYRVDLLLINLFLDPLAVGYYSIGVVMVEQLWLISSAVSLVLFPRVAAEPDGKNKNELTPIVARAVFLVTIVASIILYAASDGLVAILYSAQYLPAVRPLRILLPGIIALSVYRVIANDIAARGRPILNTYTALGALVINIGLNLIWIPAYGISGAAAASTVSYITTLIAGLIFYPRISGNHWTSVLIPRREDWGRYRRIMISLTKRQRCM